MISEQNRYKNTDQWNTIESLEVNPCTYGQLVYEKGSKNILMEKRLCSTIHTRKTRQVHVKE